MADGLRAAFGCLPFIVAWVLFAATVGHLLRLLADRSGPLGRIITGFLGIAWSAAIFLVIPVLVVEKVDPITALRKSVMLFQKTWGEEFISNFSFGMIFSILAIPAYFFAILGMRAGLGFLISVGLAAIYLIILAMFQSALQTIFQAALYFYARNGEAPAGFPGELLANSVVRR